MVITAFIYLMIMIQVPFCNDIFFLFILSYQLCISFFFSIITINVYRMMTIIILANNHNGSYFWLEIKPINCFSYGFFFYFQHLISLHLWCNEHEKKNFDSIFFTSFMPPNYNQLTWSLIYSIPYQCLQMSVLSVCFF